MKHFLRGACQCSTVSAATAVGCAALLDPTCNTPMEEAFEDETRQLSRQCVQHRWDRVLQLHMRSTLHLGLSLSLSLSLSLRPLSPSESKMLSILVTSKVLPHDNTYAHTHARSALGYEAVQKAQAHKKVQDVHHWKRS